MSKFQETFNVYKEENKKHNFGISETLLEKVTKGLGPSIYNNDACRVSGSDKTELATVKNNYLIKKLGLKDGPELDSAISEVIQKLGSSNKNRALVYAMLCEKFGKQGFYDK